MTNTFMVLWIVMMATVSSIGYFTKYNMIGVQFLLMLVGVLVLSVSGITEML
jgi:general stress protein CsbA